MNNPLKEAVATIMTWCEKANCASDCPYYLGMKSEDTVDCMFSNDCIPLGWITPEERHLRAERIVEARETIRVACKAHASNGCEGCPLLLPGSGDCAACSEDGEPRTWPALEEHENA